MSGEGVKGRGRERISSRRPSGIEPDVGLHRMALRSWPETKSRDEHSTDWAPQVLEALHLFYVLPCSPQSPQCESRTCAEVQAWELSGVGGNEWGRQPKHSKGSSSWRTSVATQHKGHYWREQWLVTDRRGWGGQPCPQGTWGLLCRAQACPAPREDVLPRPVPLL